MLRSALADANDRHRNQRSWAHRTRLLKLVLEGPTVEVVAVNDVAEPEALAYLLRYDSVYAGMRGRWRSRLARGAISVTGAWW